MQRTGPVCPRDGPITDLAGHAHVPATWSGMHHCLSRETRVLFAVYHVGNSIHVAVISLAVKSVVWIRTVDVNGWAQVPHTHFGHVT